MKLYDISPPIGPETKVWPGDCPLRREVSSDLQRGDIVTLSSVHTTVHVGAHADAPSHYGIGAPTIDTCPLETYLGPCLVIRPQLAPGAAVGPEHLPATIAAERVLFATDTASDPTHFDENFAALDPALIEALHATGVRLVGVDTPSVDRFGADGLPVHRTCLAAGIVILEGLDLADVPSGLYELIALPLKLVGFDASPVRAVLRTSN